MGTLSPREALHRDQRRKVLMASPGLKGLDFVTVERVPVQAGVGSELWRLRLCFVPADAPGKSAVPAGITLSNIHLLLDGRPDPAVRVLSLGPVPASGDRGADNELEAQVRVGAQEAYPHDLPVYILSLRDVPDLDPLFSSAPVTFRAGEPEARMVPRLMRDAEPRERVEIDYLARDFDSFRRLMLERMAFYIPQWGERNPADLGVTIVEVLAYAADYLSYYQDAVATEAYLDTARRRISVRRHTRLLDFRLDEGTNARVWVQVRIEDRPAERAEGEPGPGFRLPEKTRLLTLTSRVPGTVIAGSPAHRRALEQDPMVFWTMEPVTLFPEHDELEVYAWGAEDYTLPRGSTAASLRGRWERLAPGDVLVFEKRVGASTGESPIDPRERQAVRLCRQPTFTVDPLTRQTVTEISWFEADALSADYPVSRTVGRVRQSRLSIVRGNVVLADHGDSVQELLEPVPAGGPFRPVLSHPGMTFRQPFDAAAARDEPAARAVEQVSWQTLPEIELVELPAHIPVGSAEEAAEMLRLWHPRWRPRYDLLGSGRFAHDFVVEVDDDGRPHLRFGDGQAGRKPAAGARFLARYRVGVGPRGNVGPHSLGHVVLPEELQERLDALGLVIVGSRNHLPGMGGGRPRAKEHAQVYAPDIVDAREFQRRCVTAEDCAELAMRHPEVRAAVARREWGGSANTFFLYVQRREGRRLDERFESRLRRLMEPCLLAGWDLVIHEPQLVPLDIRMTVVLEPGLRTEAMYERFFGEVMKPGERLFDPDDLSFGDSVYASQLTTLVMGIPGVADARVDVLQRWGQPPAGELATGCLPIGPLEIARLDNDPQAPQNGTFKVRIVEG